MMAGNSISVPVVGIIAACMIASTETGMPDTRSAATLNGLVAKDPRCDDDLAIWVGRKTAGDNCSPYDCICPDIVGKGMVKTDKLKKKTQPAVDKKTMPRSVGKGMVKKTDKLKKKTQPAVDTKTMPKQKKQNKKQKPPTTPTKKGGGGASKAKSKPRPARCHRRAKWGDGDMSDID
jgi:hypothetical protein